MSALLLLLACADSGADTADPCAVDYGVTWDGWADGFFATYCRACHSSESPERYGAPAGVDFDLESDVLDQRGAIEDAVLVRESMPLGGGVHEDDRALLRWYLRCELDR